MSTKDQFGAKWPERHQLSLTAGSTPVAQGRLGDNWGFTGGSVQEWREGAPRASGGREKI